jgi:hypothetical protein
MIYLPVGKTTVFIPTTTRPGLSFSERARDAALNYSSDPALQKAFTDGAKWYQGDCDFSWWMIFPVLYVLFLAGGLMESSIYVDKKPFDNFAKILFPTYGLGLLLGNFLFKRR